MDRPFPFPHQRLDAWRVAVELVTQVKTLCERAHPPRLPQRG